MENKEVTKIILKELGINVPSGIVVKSIDKAIKQWENIFGYTQMTEVVENTRQKVKVVFLQKNNSILIKLVSPCDNKSTVFKFAMKGGGLHHLAFKCDDIDDKLNELKENGLRILNFPEPGEAFNNNLIAFLYAKNGLNIELFDTNEKANIIS